jgi:uncharacterized repeat protein (TIGR01451 family)
MMHVQQNTDNREQKAKRARQGALVLVLGLLGVLVVVTTANAYVTKTTHTSLADFEQGTFTYTGLVDLPGVESVQLMPVGLAEGWTYANRTLPERLTNLVAAASDGRLYVGGGTKYDLSINEAVWSSQVGVDGTLGAWQVQPSMPTGRTAAGFAVHELNQTQSMLYVVGGYIPDPDGGFIPRPVLTDTIVRAQIDRDSGALAGWEEDAQRLPVAIQNPSVVVHDDFLYVIGGWDKGSGGGEAYNKVLYSPIQADGSLGSFAETSPLTPTGFYYGLALVYEGVTADTLYFVGGLRNDTSQPTSMVQFADFVPGGGLTAWSSPGEGNLPRTLWGQGGVYLSDAFQYGEILLTGGIDGSAVETEGISSTVKVALVDPTSSFRLYDWCQGASQEECDIGAWQTGTLLDENIAEDGRRAFHGTVASGAYVYVLGGQGLKMIPYPTLQATDEIFVGAVGDVEAMYSPEGTYDSMEVDLLRPSTLLQLEWDTTISRVDDMSLSVQYRYRAAGGGWSTWSAPVSSISGTNVISITSQTSHPENIRYFQYRANLTTRAPMASPRLNSMTLYYDVPDPDLAVIKDTGHVISVPLGSNLVYNIQYENNGGWVAEDAVLTEILPENTTFAGTPGWEQVGSSNMYTYQVGDVPWGEGGTVPFEIVVNDHVPPNTWYITNRVEIDYPPMVDIWDNTIVDPVMDDNVYEFSTQLAIYSMTVTMEADPPFGGVVTPGSFITYTIRYTNLGTMRASQVVLTDTLDPLGSYTVVSTSAPPAQQDDNVWSWNIGPVPCKQAGELEIVVQLDDILPNNWLVTNQAALFSPEGDPFVTPVLTHTVMNLDGGGQPLGMVDLTITDFYWQPATPSAGVWPRFYATVANIGTADAVPLADSLGFWLALYIKPDPSQPPLWPVDHNRGFCLEGCTITRPAYVGYITQLPAGQERLVSFEYIAQDPSPDFPAEGTYGIYVQTDLAFDNPLGIDNPYWGRYPEDSEANNIWQGTMHLGPLPSDNNVYLPMVLRSAP